MNAKLKNAIILTVPVAALTAFAGAVYWLLIYRKEQQLTGLLPAEISGTDLFWCAAGLACAAGITCAFLKLMPMKYLYDSNVRILADAFSMKFLAVYFVPNAFYEELLFRGALQPVIGLIPASLLFTAVHLSYYKRPVLLAEVFLQGLVLGMLYEVTGSLWITTFAHTAFNTVQMWLIKSGRIQYCLEKGEPLT